MTQSPEIQGTVAGLAALSICESLLIALSDLKIMKEKDASDVLLDAAAAHRGAAELQKATSPSGRLHLEVAAIIERLIAGGNSVPH